jgi:hypothetical protein
LSSLIATMLGRLNLDVETCLGEFRKLGEQIFGHPRKVHVKNKLWAGSKYDCERLEEIIKGVVDKYKKKEDLNDLGGGPWKQFKQEPPSDGVHFCKT